MFRAIASPEFQPFDELRMFFPPVENQSPHLAEVHLLTGVNGTGKTRILSLLAALLGNPEPLRRRIGRTQQNTTIIDTTGEAGTGDEPLTWGNRLLVSSKSHHWPNRGMFGIEMEGIPAFAYSGTAYLTDDVIGVMEAVNRPAREHCLSFLRPAEHSKTLIQALANLKIQAAMDLLNQEPTLPPAGRALKLMSALERALTEITQRRVSFVVNAVPKLSLEVNWDGRRLRFDELPDGLRSIIGWMAHALVMMDVYLEGRSDPQEVRSVFLLDEIEAHLHPAWQRRILPAFQRLFPRSQIFIASHSPFLISSLNEGWIHQLTFGEDKTVHVQTPIKASQGDSYLSVLEEIMGVTELYDPDTEELLKEFREARDRAYKGDASSDAIARALASEIAQRSNELSFMMGQELRQMERQLAKLRS